MDQTPMQQTVMESPQETSLPQEVDISTLSISTPTEPEETISTTPETEHAESPAPADAATSDAVASYEPLSYDELFPALPGGIPGSGAAGSGEAPSSNWSQKTQESMRITSSVITQVFRVPVEER